MNENYFADKFSEEHIVHDNYSCYDDKQWKAMQICNMQGTNNENLNEAPQDYHESWQ